MRRKIVRLTVLTMLVALIAVPLAAAGVKRMSAKPHGEKLSAKGRTDARTSPLKAEQQALLKKALESKVNGKTKAKALEVARGQFVELAREGEYSIWTLPGEFADLAHNLIPEPDRSVDNSTIWRPDFNRDYYMDMLFNDAKGANSMRNFYIEQSSGRFTVNGDVSDWVPVPGNGATYDDDLGGAAIWQFLIDSTDSWYAGQLAAGKTPAEIDEWLSQFDKRDRYDFDADGDFNEADGYIDTFQSVHAGLGNEDGGGVLGDSAIWSHSWYAYFGLIGDVGPMVGDQENLAGGIQVGDSKYWVGDYTVQPENGGVGVFAHEYGHDLGLPDLYDTVGANDNACSFWTLMSDGSNISDGTEDIGSKPSHMGIWEKFQLGWLNYQVAYAGRRTDLKLGPMETNTKQAQGIFVILPQKEVVSDIGDPFAGANFYYSGAGNNIDNMMYRSFDLAAGSQLTAKVKYDIELDWDYAYVVVSTDNGASWTSVPTSLSTTTDPNGQNFGFGITGTSAGWVDMTADLSAFTGPTLVGFRYWTDGAVVQSGFMADEISVGGAPADGAETDAGWTYDPADGGFRVSSGVEAALFSHYYALEFRQYRGYDTTLQVGPYFFGYMNDPLLVNKVDHFPLQDGLLINYWDTSQPDNNVSEHPGQGMLLPVDAHPAALYRVDDQLWRGRIQTYDSTFGFEATDALSLHVNSVLSPIASQPAVSVFSDLKDYYDEANPFGSVIVPMTGTQVRVKSYSALGNFLEVQVAPASARR